MVATLTLLLFFLSSASFVKVEALPLTVNVTDQGDYTISRGGSVWLQSAPTFFIVDNVTYSAADSTLTLLGVNQTVDAGYLVYNLYYRANDTNIIASVHVYNGPFVGFNVTFPDGANGTKATSPDHVTCGFPGFRVDPPPAKLAYMSYGTSAFEAKLGRWENGSVQLHDGRQGSGPLTLFDKNNDAMVIGPSCSFTVTSLWHDAQSAHVYWGVMGGVTQLPAGFHYSLVLLKSEGHVGNLQMMVPADKIPSAITGIEAISPAKAVGEWAMAVRMNFPAPFRPAKKPDSLLDKAGYWTGPGSAYYTSPEPGKTYEDTLIDVRTDAFNQTNPDPSVDYTYVELDDWWYVKGQGGGVKTWTAQAGYFPSGIAGMANKTQWWIAAACGVWSPDNTYAKQNGGKYDFLTGNSCSLPNDQAFWDDLFTTAVKNRVRAFVQKDMDQQYMCMTSDDSDVNTAVTWLSQLNVSAEHYGMELLFSGALPRLAMEAAFSHSVVPVVRVGSGSMKDTSHWKVGVANIFVDGLGLRPFFGITQSYNASATKLSPMLYSLLTTLTGGPVAIGDAVGKSNRLLIERCCSADGRVLSPLLPAKAIDAQLQQAAWGGQVGATGEVWTTRTGNRLNSEIDVNLYHGIIMATALTRPFSVTPSNTGLDFDWESGVYAPKKLYRSYNPYILHDFSEDSPFLLDNCTIEQYCLYHVAPVFTFKGQEVVLMGDLNKWVPMSSQRVQRVEVGETILVHTRGVPDEKVYIWFHIDGHLLSLEHRIGADGTGIVKYELPPSGSTGRNSSSVSVVAILCLGLLLSALRA